jgi:hypothetical protein
MAATNLYGQPGIYGTINVPAPVNAPGARIESSCWCDNSGNFWLFGGNGKAESPSYGFMNDLWKFGNCVDASYTIKSSRDVLCEGETFSLSVAFADSLSWNTGETTSVIVVTASANTTYTATIYDNYGCELVATYAPEVSPCEGISEEEGQPSVSLYPNPGTGSMEIAVMTAGEHTLWIYDATGSLVYTRPLASGKNSVQAELAPGLYYYRVDQTKGKLIIR